MNQQELWQTVLAQIQLKISEASFATWFQNTNIVSQEKGSVVVSVPTAFAKEWLEQKYNKYILKILHDIDSTIKKVRYKVLKSDLRSLERVTSSTLNKEEQLKINDFQTQKNTNLNPKYTFDNFITGSFNELAHAAGWAVTQKPGKVYNPLFIYGGVGLGKTHLLQAIGNKISNRKNKNKVKYIPTEKLVSNIISAIQNRTVEELRDRYAHNEVDVLIVDDVQFLSGKEKTQEEFFYIFNSLYGKNKQIILSSDRSPKSISTLTERLRSRFEGGMIADISIPKLETKIAILKTKCQEKKVRISEEILNYIATKIKRNIRELEGALNILLAHQKLNKKTLSFEKSKVLLRNITSSPNKNINAKKIIHAVTNFYDLSVKDITSSSRKKEVVKPRQIAMYLLRKELKSSFPFIGRRFGGRDHTTAIHSCRKIKKELKKNKKLEEEIELIKHNILCV